MITTNESAVITKPVFDAVVVKDSEGNGCFSNPPRADQSHGSEVFCETDYFVNKVVSSETGPRRRRRKFPKSDWFKSKGSKLTVRSGC